MKLSAKAIAKRSVILLTAPVWVPLAFALLALYVVTANIFMIIGGPIYWVVTGKDITQTKYNLWGI